MVNIAERVKGELDQADRPRVRVTASALVSGGVAVVFFAGYLTMSVLRHRHLLTGGFDLGIFEQAVRAYAHGQAPVADIIRPDFNLLGDHFHPILILLAPVYRLFPGPVTLLVAQAVLLAVSIIPITRLAISRTGLIGGALLGTAYGLAWGIQNAVNFDFHEVVFAVPLLAFSLTYLVRQRWWAAALWALPLVLVKDDLGLAVAAIGAVLFLRRQRRLGIGVAVFGLAAFALTVLVLIPAFRADGIYPYFQRVGDQGEGKSLLSTLIGLPAGLFTPEAKLRTLAFWLLPTLFLAVRSPLLLVAVPTLLWRFSSTNHLYWADLYHYDTIVMPIVFVALLDGLPMLLDSGRVWLRRAGQLVVPVACLLVALLISIDRPFSDFFDAGLWARDARAENARAELAKIPDGATVGAGNRLAPLLTSRCRVYLFPDFHDRDKIQPEWVVVTPDGDWPMAPPEQARVLRELEASGYQAVVRTAELVVLRR